MFFRAKRVIPEVLPLEIVTPIVTPLLSQHELNCLARGVNKCNTGKWLPAGELPLGTINRVSLPGDRQIAIN